jgi:hypothetical protein
MSQDFGFIIHAEPECLDSLEGLLHQLHERTDDSPGLKWWRLGRGKLHCYAARRLPDLFNTCNSFLIGYYEGKGWDVVNVKIEKRDVRLLPRHIEVD